MRETSFETVLGIIAVLNVGMLANPGLQATRFAPQLRGARVPSPLTRLGAPEAYRWALVRLQSEMILTFSLIRCNLYRS
jgi:hypothetical protein